MIRTIEFIFDFGSPNAYLAWRVMPGVLARTGATLEVTPCLLGGLFKLTGNQAPMVTFGAVRGKLAYEQLEFRRFMERHGLTAFRMNPHFPVNTLLIMRGLVAAQRWGIGNAYLEAVLSAMWEQALKLDDPAVVTETLTAAGLDAQAILQATQNNEVKVDLASNTERVPYRGAFGIPTFFVGNEMFFGKEPLAQAEEALAG